MSKTAFIFQLSSTMDVHIGTPSVPSGMPLNSHGMGGFGDLHFPVVELNVQKSGHFGT